MIALMTVMPSRFDEPFHWVDSGTHKVLLPNANRQELGVCVTPVSQDCSGGCWCQHLRVWKINALGSHGAELPCLLPRRQLKILSSPILSTHTWDPIPPTHDGIRSFSTMSDLNTQQCPASFTNVLIYFLATSAFKRSGLGGHVPSHWEAAEEEVKI